MTVLRALAILGVFVLTSAGWAVLGTATKLRTDDHQSRLENGVAELWGRPVTQYGPAFIVKVPGTEQVRHVLPTGNTIDVKLQLEHRKKGLIWYPTYHCDFSATYTLENTDSVAQKVIASFNFPVTDGTYDNFSVTVDGTPLTTPVNTAEGIREIIELQPGKSREFSVRYRTRGLNQWQYIPAQNTRRLVNLALRVDTNFHAIDFVPASLSPTAKRSTPNGMTLSWHATDLLTSQDVGIIMPERINPGPLVTRITFFAPVCLLFFFVMVGTAGAVRKLTIHPMHYAFVAAGFFAFHLLFAYLVDVVNVHLAFAISAATTVFLVTSYLSATLGSRLPWKALCIGQLVYLILFSYSFFLNGLTGLTVTIGSIATLAALMRLTAAIDWDRFFDRSPENEVVTEASSGG